MDKATELEQKYGVTAEQIATWSEECERGELPGEPVGDVVMGRPLLFGEELKSVGYKDTPAVIEAMDRKAKSQNKTRSEYLRDLVRRDLATA